ncbi:ABC transporter substrate-binding protein [Aureimonas sp. AU4]|uniref:ABC transporter substrate-binding protein n=1 Tax=Aureimonas sp. AU4 TaxID=1638163 RepID=UPI00078163EE|nr:ABC transporter substrate-binding protein [Aureimonas sp. AU4]
MRPNPIRRLLPALALLAGLLAPGLSPAQALPEPPLLAGEVASGALPPMAKRLPAEPLRTDLSAMNREPGRYGGTLRLIETQARDTRRMVVFGYARLVGYTPDGRIEPDVARSVDVEAGRIFTFHLRPGHRWSDGEPFTAEDFRYYWEDVANDPKLGKNGLPRQLLVDGKGPAVTFPDAETIRYEWAAPNPDFLPSLAASLPLEIFRPAHYLKQFHARYADAAALERRLKDEGQRNWQALHFKHDQSYKNTDPDLPSLQPWVLATRPPADRFLFRRNPYFHRVDGEGRQLPYIDEVSMGISSAGLIPAMTSSGQTDLQTTALTLGNYAFVKAAEERSDYDVLRWPSGRGSRMVLFPDLNAGDADWRALLQTSDFRRALSLGINREDIAQAIYYGLARPAADTVLPASPLFEPDLATRWAHFDPAAANRLLDGLGLTGRDSAGTRRMANGRPLDLVVEFAGEDGEQTDVLQLIAEDWRRIGVRMLFKAVERDSLASRLSAGSPVMTVGSGLENGAARAEDSPAALAPTDSSQPSWPAWGLHYESGGKLGEAPALPFASRQLELNGRWRRTLDPAEKRQVWQEMLRLDTDEVPRIGIVADVDQIIVASRRLRNLPRTGRWNFEPGAYFGSYRPDTFFLADDATLASGSR